MRLALVEYTHNSDLPKSVLEALADDNARTVFRLALNHNLRQGLSEMHAYIKAYKAVADAGYQRNGDKFIAKDSPAIGDVHVNRPLGSDVDDEDEDEEKDKDDPGSQSISLVQKRISGNSNISLNSNGKKLAEKVGQRIAARGGLDVLHCSPLKRAQETRDAIAESNPDTYCAKPNDALRPWRLGDAEGKMPRDVKNLITHYIENPDETPPGKGADGKPAEPFNEAIKRQLDFLNDAHDDCLNHPTMKIGAVMHSRGMELLQAYVDADCPDDYEDLDLKDLIHPDDPEHTSMLRWGKEKLKEIDLEDDDELEPGFYLILHGLTDDDGDEGNADELKKAAVDGSIEKIIREEGGRYHVYSHDGSKHLGGPYDTKDEAVERLRQVEGHKNKNDVKKFHPPIEVQQAAKKAYDAGAAVIDITEVLSSGDGLEIAEIQKIADHFAAVESHTDSRTTQNAWGGKHAGKWAARVLSKYDSPEVDALKAEGDDPIEWITVNGKHIPIGGSNPKSRAEIARANYNANTKEKQDIADASERKLSAALGIPRTSDNEPFDLKSPGKFGVEIKTLIDLKGNQVTMRKDCRERKLQEAKKEKLRMYTIVADMRHGAGKAQYYLSNGVGCFRLPVEGKSYNGSMQKVTLSQLKEKIR